MNDELNRVMEVFKKHFQPALCQEDADETMTTEEVFDVFKDLLQNDELDISSMFTLLKSHGYEYDWVFDRFKWLLKSA
jgi:hypothetical protein